ncbi:uncharacterized protein TRAVEDRAFT_29928 [Trametes versicolor FP-101664 SS1]|uniref:uncharacterized protein n=1 Tax=Trametes versicolor (strain FP-101664) TaxID=717944 RepID=UPI000462317F|nr:uncharacterized protein TRAVEDRAFT_29928 [Trametes versicolor FP-101664 SS1]EIW56320.1 hypothetical protein TRAVEDRAFT_29928 [Trametes versicolor FP-101664 SS1]
MWDHDARRAAASPRMHTSRRAFLGVHYADADGPSRPSPECPISRAQLVRAYIVVRTVPADTSTSAAQPGGPVSLDVWCPGCEGSGPLRRSNPQTSPGAVDRLSTTCPARVGLVCARWTPPAEHRATNVPGAVRIAPADGCARSRAMPRRPGRLLARGRRVHRPSVRLCA